MTRSRGPRTPPGGRQRTPRIRCETGGWKSVLHFRGTRLPHPMRVDLIQAHRRGDRLRCLFGEQHAAGLLAIESANRFQRAAATIGESTGVPQACASSGAMPKSSSAAKMNARASQPMIARPIRHAAQQRDVRSGQGFDARAFGTVADHHELAIRKQPERVDDKVDALVGDQARYGDIRVAPGSLRIDRRRGNGRKNHCRFAVVAAANALRDGARDRDEMVDAHARGAVPSAQACKRSADHAAPNALVEADLAQVWVLQVPCVAHRRVAVADVQLRGDRAHAFGHSVRTRDHKVVGGYVEALYSAREKWQVAPERRARERQPLDERRANRSRAQARPVVRRHEIHQREQIGVRIEREQLGECQFSAAPGVEPVMDDRNAHSSFPRMRETSVFRRTPLGRTRRRVRLRGGDGSFVDAFTQFGMPWSDGKGHKMR